jgi:alkylated DNA repair protein (DNA oxidative demethylase)
MEKILSDKAPRPTVLVRGVAVYQGLLDRAAQEAVLQDVREIVRAAPLFQPVMPSGRKMSVRMSAAGQFGWISDQGGYRYAPTHPSGVAWPAIPPRILELWRGLAQHPRLPECCLVNFYPPEARMGLHQDRDEADLTAPVVSLSLGDDGLFRVGNVERGGRTESIWLRSGDVAVLGGPSRLVHHGVDRIRPGSSDLLRDGGRVNITLRVVT